MELGSLSLENLNSEQLMFFDGSLFCSYIANASTVQADHCRPHVESARLAQAARRVGRGGHGGGPLRAGDARRDECRCRLGDSGAGVQLKMVLSAGGAVGFTGVFIAQAGELVASANAIAVAGFGSGLDGDERHNKGNSTFSVALVQEPEFRRWKSLLEILQMSQAERGAEVLA